MGRLEEAERKKQKTLEQLKEMLSPEWMHRIENHFDLRNTALQVAGNDRAFRRKLVKKYNDEYMAIRLELKTNSDPPPLPIVTNRSRLHWSNYNTPFHSTPTASEPFIDYDQIEQLSSDDDEPDDSNQIAMTPIQNMGNTCYMNSVIFCALRFVPMFTQYIHSLTEHTSTLQEHLKMDVLSKEYETFRILHYMYGLMTAMEIRVIKIDEMVHKPFQPNAFISSLSKLKPEYIERNQQDAHEFLLDILKWLEKCSKTLVHASVENAPDQAALCTQFHREFYQTYFEGRGENTIKCTQCETINRTDYEFSIITVNVPKHITEEWLRPELTRIERVEGYRCSDNCNELTVAERSCLYPRLPSILILQLQHNDFNPATNERLDCDTATVPMKIDCFCSECQQRQNIDHDYHLNAVIAFRRDGPSCGHYITFVRLLTPVRDQSTCCGVKLNPFTVDYNYEKTADTWFKCDDTANGKGAIQPMTNREFANFLAANTNRFKPYLAFYARADLIQKHQGYIDDEHSQSHNRSFSESA